MIPGMKILASVFAVLCVAFAFADPARAHPHVWVTVQSEVIYNDKGEVTREELAGLADVNITNLKDSDFFTYVKAAGKDIALGDASDYWLDYKDEVLTLYFTLPLKTSAKEKELTVEVYDPTFFVDFG